VFTGSLAEHQIRRWDSCYRWAALALLARAFTIAAIERSRGPLSGDQILLSRQNVPPAASRQI
jgi:hypothetical protein